MPNPGQTTKREDTSVGTMSKYLIGMVAGAALVGGAGLALAAAGTAKYEPCKVTQPGAGVTQLCDTDGPMASSGARGGAGAANGTNGTNGNDGLNSGTIANNQTGGELRIIAQGPGSFPGFPPSGSQNPSVEL